MLLALKKFFESREENGSFQTLRCAAAISAHMDGPNHSLDTFGPQATSDALPRGVHAELSARTHSQSVPRQLAAQLARVVD